MLFAIWQDMACFRILGFLIVAGFLLQGCNSVYTADVIKRSITDVTLPLGGIRLPPGDTCNSAQGSFSLTRQEPLRPVNLQHGSGTAEYGIADAGNASLSMPSIQGSASISAWLKDRYRVGFAADISGNGGSFGFEAGGRWGRIVSLEVFGGFGLAATRSGVDWSVETTHDEDDGEAPRTTIVTQFVKYDQPNFYWSTGVHLGSWRNGPWIEGVALHQGLFQAKTKRKSIWVEVPSVSAGWAFGIPHGKLNAFFRGTGMKDGWKPSGGIQLVTGVRIPN
jgi:hypothetical protein